MLRQQHSRLTFAVVCLAALLHSLPSFADTVVRGRVVRIADGDTITVLDSEKHQHKIRLVGIDAPEKKQAFGQVSRQNLARLVFGKNVTVEVRKLDHYRRELGKVVVGDVDANLEQIKAGLAWHYKKYAREQPTEERAAYSEAERVARENHIGLWRDANPIPPWEFRHGARLKRNELNN